MASSREHSREDDVGDLDSSLVNCRSKVRITVIFRLPANIPSKKPLQQNDITSQQKRNHSLDERHIVSKSASRYFSFASSHNTRRASIHPRIQFSHPTKHVNSDWVRARDYEVRERISHTCPSSYKNFFQSIFVCVAILMSTSYWSVRVTSFNFKLNGGL